MTPNKKKRGFKENDRYYIFYEKKEFYNVVKRFLFLSKSDSLEALAGYLDIPVEDIFDALENWSIPVDWILRMGFRLYEMIAMLSSDDEESMEKFIASFDRRYQRFIRHLHETDKKKLTESMEKALLFGSPLSIDEATGKYLKGIDLLIRKMNNKMNDDS